jgi:N-formylmaleamate deformylase
MPELNRPTVSLNYEDEGSGDPALVFLHGWCDSSSVWAETTAALSTRHRCLAPDMRGHGQSGQPRDFCYAAEALANDVVAVCEAAGVTRPVLIGHSFGGMLAAVVAARSPGFARALVIVDQGLDFRPMAAQVHAMEQVIRSPESHLSFRTQMLGSMMTPLMPERSRERIIAASAQTPVEVGLALWAPLFEFSTAEMEAFSDRLLSALGQQPVCLVDGQANEDYYRTVAQHAPEAKTHVLDCGHWVHLERPEEFHTVLAEFLKSL